jgi:hypothetical protein
MKAAMRIIGLLLINASEMGIQKNDHEKMEREIKVRIATHGFTKENAMAIAEVVEHFSSQSKKIKITLF